MYIRRVKACIQLAKICHGRINDARCIIRKQFFSDLLYQIDLPYVSQITCVQTVKPKALLFPVFQYSRNIIRQIMELVDGNVRLDTSYAGGARFVVEWPQ